MAEYQQKLKEWGSSDPATRGERPTLTREFRTAAEFFVQTIGQAIQQAHPGGNVQTLRRTTSIMGELDGALKSGKEPGVVILNKDDYDYIKSSFNKADKWVNEPENARVLVMLADIIETAKEEEI